MTIKLSLNLNLTSNISVIEDKHFLYDCSLYEDCVRNTSVILFLLVMFVLMCQVFVIRGMHGDWHLYVME